MPAIDLGRIAGKDGFSPAITENSGNDAETYRLDITTKDGSFTTPNLKGQDGGSGSPGSGSGSGNPAAGMFAFEIREDGCLWLVSDDAAMAEKFYINESGCLVYRMEG